MSDLDYFSVAGITELSSLPNDSKIHLIGVSGVAMGQLALALKRAGYIISGSDKEFYDPIGSLLKSSDIKLFEGYSADNIKADIDLVVIGNAVSRDNPEVQAVYQSRMSYSCFSATLYEILIRNRKSVVITGTHGKSTTTALTSYLLESCGLKPSYFIGAVSNDLETSLKVNQGQVSVVEGDEYDSAFFAKIPKFKFYKPNILVINAIEFDHADIYPNLEAIDREFSDLIKSLNENDLLIYCSDHEHLVNVVKNASCKAKILSFGENHSADFRLIERETKGLSQKLTIQHEQECNHFELPLAGLYNARNFVASLMVCLELGITSENIANTITNFRSVKRRLELKIDKPNLKLIEDFAHHPSAIASCLSACHEAYPDYKLLAIFEPRSNTSRQAVFQNDYLTAFAKTDIAIISSPVAKAYLKNAELLDINELCSKLNKSGIDSRTFESTEEIFQHVCSLNLEGYIIIVMSNGSFGGLIEKLSEHFK